MYFPKFNIHDKVHYAWTQKYYKYTHLSVLNSSKNIIVSILVRTVRTYVMRPLPYSHFFLPHTHTQTSLKFEDEKNWNKFYLVVPQFEKKYLKAHNFLGNQKCFFWGQFNAQAHQDLLLRARAQQITTNRDRNDALQHSIFNKIHICGTSAHRLLVGMIGNGDDNRIFSTTSSVPLHKWSGECAYSWTVLRCDTAASSTRLPSKHSRAHDSYKHSFFVPPLHWNSQFQKIF